MINNYWSRNIQKANLEFLKRRCKGKYISHIDTKNFAIISPLMKELMFDADLGSLEDLDLYLRLKEISGIRFNPEIKVRHNHKSSFVDTVKINFNRAWWTLRIYKKYGKCKGVKKEPMLESLSSFRNWLFWPFWMIVQFIKRPFGEAWFVLISETS